MSDQKNQEPKPFNAPKARFVRQILPVIIANIKYPHNVLGIDHGVPFQEADILMAERYYDEMVARGYIQEAFVREPEFLWESTPVGSSVWGPPQINMDAVSTDGADSEVVTPAPKMYPESRIANQVSQIKGLNEKNRRLVAHIGALQFTLSKRKARIAELEALVTSLKGDREFVDALDRKRNALATKQIEELQAKVRELTERNGQLHKAFNVQAKALQMAGEKIMGYEKADEKDLGWASIQRDQTVDMGNVRVTCNPDMSRENIAAALRAEANVLEGKEADDPSDAELVAWCLENSARGGNSMLPCIYQGNSSWEIHHYSVCQWLNKNYERIRLNANSRPDLIKSYREWKAKQ